MFLRGGGHLVGPSKVRCAWPVTFASQAKPAVTGSRFFLDRDGEARRGVRASTARLERCPPRRSPAQLITSACSSSSTSLREHGEAWCRWQHRDRTLELTGIRRIIADQVRSLAWLRRVRLFGGEHDNAAPASQRAVSSTSPDLGRAREEALWFARGPSVELASREGGSDVPQRHGFGCAVRGRPGSPGRLRRTASSGRGNGQHVLRQQGTMVVATRPCDSTPPGRFNSFAAGAYEVEVFGRTPPLVLARLPAPSGTGWHRRRARSASRQRRFRSAHYPSCREAVVVVLAPGLQPSCEGPPASCDRGTGHVGSRVSEGERKGMRGRHR